VLKHLNVAASAESAATQTSIPHSQMRGQSH